MSPLWLLAIVGLVVGGAWAYDTPHCDGRQTIVHLFEWKWTDIAAECERFLGPNEFCAVQVSPPMEHLVASSSGYPWWQRYQPISYKLESRSGNEGEFIDMVNRCNAVGVRIIVDAVVNHMTGIGQSGTGSGGSSFNADNRDFPGVPYGYNDFTPRDQCPSSDGQIHDYSNVNEVRNCMLVGLTDLYGGSDYVRQKVSEYFNHVIDIGVMGFRVDASKHMWPGDLEAIQGLTKDLNTDAGFPAGARPFFYHEVIDQGGEPITVQEYFGVGRTTEFRFGKKIAWGVNDFSQLGNIYDQGWGMAPSDKALNFVDNHDNQRGHGGAGDILTYKNGKDYTLGVCFSLAHDYGFMRIMSSYYFDNSDQGPPSGGGGSTSDVIINDDGTCGGGWVCEHRWNAITQMVRFRNAVAGTSIENWYQEGDNVAFSRGNKGFFAMTKYGNFDKTLQTGMPAGTYCELISHCANQVTVNADGTAMISIHNEQEPVFAICVGCGDGPSPTVDPSHTTTPGPTLPPVPGTARTVIFIHKITSPGQDLFIRGGIDSEHRPGCTETAETDPCAITQETNSLGSETHYEKYNSWRVGDTKLDWFGAQPGQGTYSGQGAEGSPLAWTTNTPGAAGYQELNTFGEHYWMIDVQMNCEETEGGWFELKGYLTNGAGWETDISQVTKCAGDAGGSKPYTSTNHMGRCGYINVFEFSGNSCQVLSFPNES